MGDGKPPEKAAVPSWSVCATWLSTVLMVSFSAAVYPQAIQRIYAARNVRSLRRSVSAMAFMPLVTMVPVVLLGIVGLQELSGLEGVAADQVVPLLLGQWAARSAALYALAIAVLLAVLAAIMSSADSVLLTLSSMLAKDVLGKTVLRGAPSARLTHAGKTLSWGIVAVLVGIALVPRITLWGLTELKMEMLVQVAPAVILGLHWKNLTARGALTGMVAGLSVMLALPAMGMSRPMGFHDGMIGFGVNLLLCVAVSRLDRPRSPSAA
ncbi:MAG: sodium:solute symporter family transporter [Acidobacteriota bacterium]